MKFCVHLSTRIQDKRNELPLINCMTDLALDADSGGFGAISLTEHHLHENKISGRFASDRNWRLRDFWALRPFEPYLR